MASKSTENHNQTVTVAVCVVVREIRKKMSSHRRELSVSMSIILFASLLTTESPKVAAEEPAQYNGENIMSAMGAPKQIIDPNGVDLMSLNRECKPAWLPNTSIWEDARCMRWPEICDYMPRPDPVSFTAFTEMFPCFLLTKEMILRVSEEQHRALTAIEKCMWDYVLMWVVTTISLASCLLAYFSGFWMHVTLEWILE